jgi:hypothetical protein
MVQLGGRVLRVIPVAPDDNGGNGPEGHTAVAPPKKQKSKNSSSTNRKPKVRTIVSYTTSTKTLCKKINKNLQSAPPSTTIFNQRHVQPPPSTSAKFNQKLQPPSSTISINLYPQTSTKTFQTRPSTKTVHPKPSTSATFKHNLPKTFDQNLPPNTAAKQMSTKTFHQNLPPQVFATAPANAEMTCFRMPCPYCAQPCVFGIVIPY